MNAETNFHVNKRFENSAGI